MSKIAVLQKKSLIKTKSGAESPVSPDDQELIEGVKEAIDNLRLNGFELSIVSDESMCDPRPCPIEAVKVGSYYVEGGEYFKIIGSLTSAVGTTFDLDQIRYSDQDYIFTRGGELNICYKTIPEAAAEMKTALKLTGIFRGVFCPDLKGEKIFYGADMARKFVDGIREPNKRRGQERSSLFTIAYYPDTGPEDVQERSLDGDFGNYRTGGMIEYLEWLLDDGPGISQILYFGDRPDRELCLAANLVCVPADELTTCIWGGRI